MSLEQALIDNTAAMKELGLIMAGLSLNQPATPEPTDKTVKTGTTKAPAQTKDIADGVKPAGTGPAADTAGKGNPEKPAAEKPADVAAKEVTYDDAKDAVTAVVRKNGRDAGLAVLAQFGTDSLLKVLPENWADVIAACNKVLEEAALV